MRWLAFMFSTAAKVLGGYTVYQVTFNGQSYDNLLKFACFLWVALCFWVLVINVILYYKNIKHVAPKSTTPYYSGTLNDVRWKTALFWFEKLILFELLITPGEKRYINGLDEYRY